MPNPTGNTLELKDLNFAFRDESAILKGLDRRVHGGEALWVRGANGSGKSTLLRLIAGELAPTSGSIAAPEQVRYLPDTVFFDEYLRISEQLALYSALTRRRIGYTELGEWFAGPEAPAQDTLISNFSLGWRKRLGLALLFAQDADLYILDEPYNGLDDEGVELCDAELRRVLERGAIVVMSSHRQIEGVSTVELHIGDFESCVTSGHPA